jgi:hypothetical protein
MSETVKLKEEELKKIQEMNAEFSKAKMSLGDLELQKHGLLKHIETIRQGFAENEMELIQKYGADAVINIQTGEVTKKQD